MAYEFHYTPTGTGVISGKEVLEQTEDAINDLGNTAISGVQEALDKAEQALTNSENAVDDAQTALNTANTAEGVAIQAQNDVSNLSGTVTNIGNRVTTAEGNITNLQGRMTTAEGNITNLQGRMTTAEGNIGNLQTAVSTAQATANSAQQTATTARQQSFVFRYSSTALTPSSTNSNALLDNTDNLKVGDKVIDSSGVLFSITAIDTANSTFTVGTALIDLANDSDVVHKSGNETIGGNKTFTDELTASINTTNGAMLLQNASYDPKTNGQSGVSTKSFSINFLTALSDTFGSFSCFGVGDRTLLRFTSRYFVDSQTVTEDSVEYNVYGDGTRSFKPRSNNNTLLGESTRKWKEIYATNYYYGATNVEFSDKFVTSDTAQTISGNKTFSSINGVEPSSLSLPVFPSQSSWIDISSYITDMTGSVANSYTPPANGYITFSATGNQVQIFSDYGLQSKFSIQSGSIIRGYHPVLKNEPIKIYMLGTSIEFFRFIPCQGNV